MASVFMSVLCGRKLSISSRCLVTVTQYAELQQLFTTNTRALDILNLYTKHYTSNLENTKKKQVENLNRLTKTDNPTTRNIVHNYSSRLLSDIENKVLKLGLNFSIQPSTVPTVDIVATLESAAQNLPKPMAEEFRHQTYTTLRNAKKPKPNNTKQECSALNRLKRDNIKILSADKGNSIVILEVKYYNTMIKQLLDKHQYKKITNDPTEKTNLVINRTLNKLKKQNLINEELSLRTNENSPPQFYGLSKVHKPNIPLRPIVSIINSPCHQLATFLVPILSPLRGNTEHRIQNSTDFIGQLGKLHIRSQDILGNFDVTYLFTNVPASETLQITRQRLLIDNSLPHRTDMKIVAFMELTTICLQSTYFQYNEELYKQTDGLAMGSSRSSILADIFKEDFEERALSSTSINPSFYVRYVDDIIVI
ncbi:uncharacterized protein LOC106458646 [Limulus polyphemus]|uniref:Uncharacterized protein LOC106458646 n=1 Tax=Limulus polyphemus TaxID=6850 RepID=A0ABM1B2S6_LIMPO|nr:uncharacterized protein LOC106458646 [Limulus polyphemus]